MGTRINEWIFEGKGDGEHKSCHQASAEMSYTKGMHFMLVNKMGKTKTNKRKWQETGVASPWAPSPHKTLECRVLLAFRFSVALPAPHLLENCPQSISSCLQLSPAPQQKEMSFFYCHKYHVMSQISREHLPLYMPSPAEVGVTELWRSQSRVPTPSI